MKEKILSKLFHIGIILIFSTYFFEMFTENYTVMGLVGLFGFILMMIGLYRNGFKF